MEESVNNPAHFSGLCLQLPPGSFSAYKDAEILHCRIMIEKLEHGMASYDTRCEVDNNKQ